jgi:hypothetical protein
MLNNGYLLDFDSYDDCKYYNVNACGNMTIDVNGKKGPNMSGRDFLSFWIVRKNGNTAYSLLPMGTQGDGQNCSSNSNSWDTSLGCTAKRMYDPDHMP